MNNLKQFLLVFALFFGLVSAASAQTADDIIQKNITATGGVENWKKIASLKISGIVNANGTEIPVSVLRKANKGMRMELTVGGMMGYMIITDKAGWNYMPFGGQTKPEALPEEAVKQSQDRLDINPLIDYKTKGTKATFLGKDEVEGTECYKVKMVYTSGNEETMFFDASNYYHIKSTAKVTANGKEMEVTYNFGDFQKLPEGIYFPMSVDMGNGPVSVKSVEINKPVDENAFVPKG